MKNDGKKESAASDIMVRRGVYYPAFGIYDGVAGFYDYGPIGVRIKKRIENQWRSLFINRTGALEIETTNIVPEVVLKASGHIDTFTDPITNCTVCKTPFRADKLLESYYEKKGMTEALSSVKKMSIEHMEKAIRDAGTGIKCERCGNPLGKVEKFNLLFKTQVGPYGGETCYLRPETTQGIYVDFIHLYKTQGLKLPVAIAQAGPAFRNEISPRQQLVRVREFTQMEYEMFIDPEDDPKEIFGFDIEDVLKTEINFIRSNNGDKEEILPLKELLENGNVPSKHFAFLLYLEEKLMDAIGMDKKAYRFRELEKEELPHYSKGNVDLEVKTSYGYIEVAGNAYRSDWDLSQHAKTSGQDLAIISNEKKVLPHVVEASMGSGRLLFSLIDNCVVEDAERGWNWLRLKESVAPYRYAVFPLQKDEKLIAKAKEIHRMMLEKNTDAYYSETASIGKRYARADEIGISHCITVDYTTLEDDTVTIRERDTTNQIRRPFVELI
ncbi:Proline--tRNA ligase [uncultured archaeon]|nr:Proline--tRNA ligase [uncultured archaeon]